MLRKNHETYKGRGKLSTFINRIAENCLHLEIEIAENFLQSKIGVATVQNWQLQTYVTGTYGVLP